MTTSRLLSKLHQPLKVIVLAQEQLGEMLAAAGVHLTTLRPHCRGRADLGVFTSLAHFKV